VDFDLDQEQLLLVDLATQVLKDTATASAIATNGNGDGDGWDATLWRRATEAGLLSVSLPIGTGGAGRSGTEACIVARAAGRSLFPLPLMNAMATAGTLSQLNDSRIVSLVSAVAEGRATVACALGNGGPDPDATPLRFSESSTSLTGEVAFIPALGLDQVLVVGADGKGQRRMVLLNPRLPGIQTSVIHTTSGISNWRLNLRDVAIDEADILDADVTVDLLDSLWTHLLVFSAAEMCGIAEVALRMTASHAGEREQFGRAIGSFQAVATRAADSYIDLQAMTWTMWRAASLLGTVHDRRAAERARFWACEGGHRVLSSAQHIHGGIGVDMDYPLHRYFLRFKQLEFTLGGANRHLADLGRMIASSTSVWVA